MAHHLRIANAGIVGRAPGDGAETETARDILRSLEMVREAEQPAMTMIAGSPGVGKTQAVKHYCARLGHGSIYIQAARGEGTAWNFAKSLAGLWGYNAPKFNTLAEARMILSHYIGKHCLLVVDEAQYLHQKNGKTGQIGEAFEWLRAAAGMGGFDVVFCGDLNLIGAVNAMPQLQSRMLRPVIIKEASRADVAAIVEGTAFATGKAIDALHHVARLKGGLRNVDNVTRIAQMFAGSDHPTLAHLKAAIIDMKPAPKGGATMIIRLGTQSSVIADRLACGDQRDRLNAIQEVLYRAQILMDAVTCDRIAMQDARTATCFAAFAPEHIADGLADGLADGAVGFMGKLCARTDDVSVQAQAQLEPEHGGAWWSMVEHGGAAS